MGHISTAEPERQRIGGTVSAVAQANPLLAQPRPRLRGWSHLLACVAALALAPLLIVFSPGGRAAAAIYAVAVIGVFGVSGTYHCVFWHTGLRGLMRRLDHSMIFVFIAATYTPFALFVLTGAASTVILVGVWSAAAAGVIMRVTWPDAPRALVVAVYVIVGWSAIAVIGDTYRALGVAGFVLLVVGGGLYTLGGVVYAAKWPNPWPRWFGYHELFHLLVIVAVASHYVAVAFFVLPRATSA